MSLSFIMVIVPFETSLFSFFFICLSLSFKTTQIPPSLSLFYVMWNKPAWFESTHSLQEYGLQMPTL